MKIQTIRQRLLHSTMIGSAALMALTAVPTVALMAPTAAMAQDYTSGSLSGSVQDLGGSPVAGASVSIRSVAQGVTRTAVTGENGSFRFALLPAGEYVATVTSDGRDPLETNVRVNVGSESDFTFTVGGGAADSSNVDDVVVVGARANLDFTQTTKGLTVDLTELTQRVPIQRDVTAVALLSPSVVTGSGDATFRSLPSIGGSTVAENAFYLNGLNITNFDTYVGGATVPFDFYQSIETKTGGYPAEYGRATGGVVNAVSKSGTNEFMFAVHGDWRGHQLDETAPDVENYVATSYNARQEIEEQSLTVEAGGPIIRDRLFAYGLYEARKNYTQFAQNTSYIERRTESPFWGVKVDGYITDDHRLEFTYFDSENERENRTWLYDGATDTILAESPRSTTLTGGSSYIAKYTGSITDWLTVSAAYGVSEDQATLSPADTTTSQVNDNRYTVLPDPTTGTTRPGFIRGSQRTLSNELTETRREFYRADADLYFTFMGDHHVRAGLDAENNVLNHVNQFNGGRRYILRQGTPCAATSTRPADPTGLVCGYGVRAGDEFVEVAYQRLGGLDIESENRAYYIQDSWDVTQDISLQLGLRYDDFLVTGLGNENQIDLSGNWGPRIGATWDPFGEGNDKIYSSFGRYFIPPASNLAFRGADYGFSEFFFAGTPDGNIAFNGDYPTLGAQMTAANTGSGFAGGRNLQACPDGGLGTSGAVGCTVSLGRGIPERAFSKTSQQLSATSEDEFILGYERRVDDNWTVGAAFTYRTLNNVSEDITLDEFVVQYCADNGYNVAACAAQWDGSWQYVVINPGQDFDIYSRGALPGDANPTCFGDLPGTPALTNCGTLMHFSAEDIGFDKPKREYLGLEFMFERAFDGVWGLQGSYVWSRSYGNYEGTVLSDAGGQTQDDAGSTQLFDYLGLADYQDGVLPNHRTHQIKLFGSYQPIDGLVLGGNMSIFSPKKYGCLGVHPTDGHAANYGSASRFCAGEPGPRGSQMETQWIYNFDMSVSYTLPSFGLPGELALRADIFNVFNFQRANELDEVYDDDGATRLPTYGAPWSYQQPRYVRLSFDWTF